MNVSDLWFLEIPHQSSSHLEEKSKREDSHSFVLSDAIMYTYTYTYFFNEKAISK